MIIFSDSTKQQIMVGLTLPLEGHMDEAQKQKHAKYQELKEQCRRQGRHTHCEPIVVESWGLAGQSLCRFSHRGD